MYFFKAAMIYLANKTTTVPRILTTPSMANTPNPYPKCDCVALVDYRLPFLLRKCLLGAS